MVNGGYNYGFHGGYKPTYSWGAPQQPAFDHLFGVHNFTSGIPFRTLGFLGLPYGLRHKRTQTSRLHHPGNRRKTSCQVS